ncbi:hypothetical protein [Hydrogenophaga laconesensis]|uniref:Uncharacterized protein n=1 Tax=Hydrogenophaga laconesensis TaxID=1805971 RepID=A0ABU1VDI9_9BURK|nr:hypothetical protein [Hydrogenophaga laconesensis]MDR7095541.1 hypothetical protein [Hydrogenophaga laconesensis]
MAESVKLGQGICPVCRSAKARYTLSSKQLCVVTCNGCNFQGFARSERSDELLRDLIPKAGPAPSPEPAPPAPAPAPEPPAPPPPPAPRRSLLSW